MRKYASSINPRHLTKPTWLWRGTTMDWHPPPHMNLLRLAICHVFLTMKEERDEGCISIMPCETSQLPAEMKLAVPEQLDRQSLIDMCEVK
ncbi:uncharacterized protein CLUP02_00792 [Colletotrichum lupini]|uniref:Uncharacterized protein n=1 Tax=Colletotrichum lupini TaxID=145971 RepID=A0A9Q8SBG4_9PEZI|nr:uncharacterized protein CLUP02_00792 [Colletotrichum lupini]UQC74144.1 hypothetical protein CLUP02_00792 [Colletotrichum lupini]